jgi:DNA-directed RNA polymerase subunit beta'
MSFKNKTFKQDQDFEKITVSLSSPDEILERSYGEI